MSGIVLGFDFGAKKIGVAVCQLLAGTANPLDVIKARDGIPDWAALDRLVNEWRPDQLVVGLPLNMDDTIGDMAAAAEKFGRRLAARYNLKVEMVDERLSTFEAKQQAKPGQQVDDIAAALVLRTWLSSRPPDAG